MAALALRALQVGTVAVTAAAGAGGAYLLLRLWASTRNRFMPVGRWRLHAHGTHLPRMSGQASFDSGHYKLAAHGYPPLGIDVCSPAQWKKPSFKVRMQNPATTLLWCPNRHRIGSRPTSRVTVQALGVLFLTCRQPWIGGRTAQPWFLRRATSVSWVARHFREQRAKAPFSELLDGVPLQ
ncbi:uncharacterized protein LOC144168376 [Haemaphysalis longicornis]